MREVLESSQNKGQALEISAKWGTQRGRVKCGSAPIYNWLKLRNNIAICMFSYLQVLENYLLWYRIYSSSFWVISIKNSCGNYVWSASFLHFFCSHWFQQTFSAWNIMLFPPSMCRLSAKSCLGILYGVGVESVACSLVRWKRALYFQIVCGAFETQVGHILLVRTMNWNIGAWNRLGKLCSCLVLHLNIMVWTIWCNGEATTLFLQ